MISFFLRICDWHVAKSKVCDFWQFFTPFNHTCGISHKWMYLFSRSGCFQMWWVRHLSIKLSLGSSREHPSSKGGSRGHAFLRKKLEILGLSLYSWKFWRKKNFIPWNSAELLQTFEIPSPAKTKATGDFTWFFLDYPWKFHFFFNWALEFLHAISSIPLEPVSSTFPVWIFAGRVYWVITKYFQIILLTNQVV